MKLLYCGLAGLFLLMAAWALPAGQFGAASVGTVIGALLLGAAFCVPREEKAARALEVWLLEHRAGLHGGAFLRYEGTPVTAATEVVRFRACFSVVFLTHSFSSRYLLRHRSRVPVVSLAYTLLTLLLGWWGIPSGPMRTVQAVYHNLRGGYVQTLGEVLAEQLDELAEEAAALACAEAGEGRKPQA